MDNEIKTNFTLDGQIVHSMNESFMNCKLFTNDDESIIYLVRKDKVVASIQVSAEDGGYYGDVRSSLEFKEDY